MHAVDRVAPGADDDHQEVAVTPAPELTLAEAAAQVEPGRIREHRDEQDDVEPRGFQGTMTVSVRPSSARSSWAAVATRSVSRLSRRPGCRATRPPSAPERPGPQASRRSGWS